MELRKPDNYYGACLATEPPLPFGLSGGMQITNTYFRQKPANQRIDSDCLQYLKSYIVICKSLSMNRSYTIRSKEFLQITISDFKYCKPSLSRR